MLQILSNDYILKETHISHHFIPSLFGGGTLIKCHLDVLYMNKFIRFVQKEIQFNIKY